MPRKIKKYRWYIVDLRRKTRKGNYYLLRVSFATKKQAKESLHKNLAKQVLYFDIVSGKEAIEFKFHFPKTKVKPTYTGYIRKYDYPPELDTLQARKSYRTKFRRWKRNYKKELKKGWV